MPIYIGTKEVAGAGAFVPDSLSVAGSGEDADRARVIVHTTPFLWDLAVGEKIQGIAFDLLSKSQGANVPNAVWFDEQKTNGIYQIRGPAAYRRAIAVKLQDTDYAIFESTTDDLVDSIVGWAESFSNDYFTWTKLASLRIGLLVFAEPKTVVSFEKTDPISPPPFGVWGKTAYVADPRLVSFAKKLGKAFEAKADKIAYYAEVVPNSIGDSTIARIIGKVITPVEWNSLTRNIPADSVTNAGLTNNLELFHIAWRSASMYTRAYYTTSGVPRIQFTTYVNGTQVNLVNLNYHYDNPNGRAWSWQTPQYKSDNYFTLSPGWAISDPADDSLPHTQTIRQDNYPVLPITVMVNALLLDGTIDPAILAWLNQLIYSYVVPAP